MPSKPSREVHCCDAIPWMLEHVDIPGCCAITSLPDVSEVGLPLDAWRAWFMDAARLVIDCVPPKSASLFFQSDIKHEGEWVDKGALVVRAAEESGARVLFHKIVCRHKPGMPSRGRPGFTHLIAVSRAMRCPEMLPIPDVITDVGPQLWVRAMGVRAAAHAVRFARDHVHATTVLDPFCGVGTVLAVSNALGLNAVGVEKSRKRSERSRQVTVEAEALD